MILKIVNTLRCLGKNERGLTLIELMIVLAIVAIIAALAIPQIMGWLDAATEEAAEADAQSLTSAIQMRALQWGISPDNFDEAHNLDDTNFDENWEDTDDPPGWDLGEFVDLDEIVNRYETDDVNQLFDDSEGVFEFDDEAKVSVQDDPNM